jgi:hypothetical protein
LRRKWVVPGATGPGAATKSAGRRGGERSTAGATPAALAIDRDVLLQLAVLRKYELFGLRAAGVTAHPSHGKRGQVDVGDVEAAAEGAVGVVGLDRRIGTPLRGDADLDATARRSRRSSVAPSGFQVKRTSE